MGTRYGARALLANDTGPWVEAHEALKRVARQRAGLDAEEGLLGICSAHHRATHRGELLIERNRDGTLTFRHADGSPYGDPTAPRAIDAQTKVFAALRHLGFREGEVKAVLAELRSDTALASASVERLLREALCRIRPRPR